MNKEVDLTNVVLHTERLTLRMWTEDDLQDFYEYASVDGVGQMAGWKPHENLEVSKRILKMFIDEKKTFAIVYEGKAIGSLGIEEYNEQRYVEFADLAGREIGYVLNKAYWGKGIMPEAVKEVMRYCFEDMKLDFLLCGYFVWNNQSKRVQEKCGFKPYRVIDHETRMGTIEKTQENIIRREEWLAR